MTEKKRRKRRKKSVSTGDSTDELHASVSALKENKRVAKRRKAQVNQSTFAGPTVAMSANEEEAKRGARESAETAAASVSKQTKAARKKCQDAQTASLVSSIERTAVPSEARTEDMELTDGSGRVYPVESMSTFREVMGNLRQRANEQVERENAKKREKKQDEAWGVVATSELTPLGGIGSSGSKSLCDYLKQTTVQDRWGAMVERDGKSHQGPAVTAWRHEMLNLIPADCRERMDKIFSERANALEVTPPPVSQAYVKDFLRSAIASAGERQCAAGRACQGVAMYHRSFQYAAAGDALGHLKNELVVREYLSPAEKSDFEQKGTLPWQRKLCVICDRWAVTMMAKCTDVRNADINMHMYKGQQGACPVMTGMPGGYDVSRCVFGETPDKGVVQMHIQHADNLYVPHVKKTYEGVTYVQWEEVGVSHVEGSLN